MCYHYGINIQKHKIMKTCGVVKVDGIIELPEYMIGKIDPTTISVQLTPIASYQELFVDRIEYGARVIVRNAAGGAINAYYEVNAEEKWFTSDV